MKKILWPLIIITIMSCCLLFPVQNTEAMNLFTLRYAFTTTIPNFTYPSELPKKRFKYYWSDFTKLNSNLTWFDAFTIDLTSSLIVLDIKTKYIITTSPAAVTLAELSIFKLNAYAQYQLWELLHQPIDHQIMEAQVRLFCDAQTDEFLFTKGISKMIQF